MNNKQKPAQPNPQPHVEFLEDQALRLQELELEIAKASSPETRSDSASDISRKEKGSLISTQKPWYRRVPLLLKVLGVGLLILIGLRIATWLISMVLLVGVVWVIYKIFWDPGEGK
jgi:hypothetical protein